MYACRVCVLNKIIVLYSYNNLFYHPKHNGVLATELDRVTDSLRRAIFCFTQSPNSSNNIAKTIRNEKLHRISSGTDVPNFRGKRSVMHRLDNEHNNDDDDNDDCVFLYYYVEYAVEHAIKLTKYVKIKCRLMKDEQCTMNRDLEFVVQRMLKYARLNMQ